MTAVNFTGGGDLKQLMGEKKIMTEDEQNMGISIDITYLKQAEHLLRTNAYQSAIKYTLKALELNAESTVKQFVNLFLSGTNDNLFSLLDGMHFVVLSHQNAMTLLARLYLVTNKWNLATEAADMVLQNDKRSTKARLVKAEALFNVCQFEHAMVHFYRGMVNQQKMHNAKKGQLNLDKGEIFR